MQINEVQSYQSRLFKSEYDIVDVPGLGYFKDTIIQRLPESKLIILFVDSSERSSIIAAGEYLYDILNCDKFKEDTPLVISCNKQDNNFPKTKKAIENDLSTEIENIKTIKQKNNLDDREQIGALFQMKKRFTFASYKNITFVETDRTSLFVNLIQHIREILLEKRET